MKQHKFWKTLKAPLPRKEVSKSCMIILFCYQLKRLHRKSTTELFVLYLLICVSSISSGLTGIYPIKEKALCQYYTFGSNLHNGIWISKCYTTYLMERLFCMYALRFLYLKLPFCQKHIQIYWFFRIKTER